MRSVEIVKQERDRLRSELHKFMAVKEARFPNVKSFKELDKRDSTLFSYLMSGISNMRIQINALEFVLNEDTYLDEPAYTSLKCYDLGITKESILAIYARRKHF